MARDTKAFTERPPVFLKFAEKMWNNHLIESQD